jgi:hypothetical protein
MNSTSLCQADLDLTHQSRLDVPPQTPSRPIDHPHTIHLLIRLESESSPGSRTSLMSGKVNLHMVCQSDQNHGNDRGDRALLEGNARWSCMGMSSHSLGRPRRSPRRSRRTQTEKRITHTEAASRAIPATGMGSAIPYIHAFRRNDTLEGDVSSRQCPINDYSNKVKPS